MRFQMMMAGCVLGLVSMAAVAQGGQNQGPAAGTIVDPVKAYNSQLYIVESEMMNAVKAMPAEKYGFAPSAAIFVPGQTPKFDGVRTFAEQATHVAQANYSFAAAISGVKPDVDVDAIGKMTKKDDVVAALAGSYSSMHKAIGTLTAANAFEVIKTQEPGLQTRGTLVAFTVGHCFDHYGQMVEYLRMNGLVPPGGGPAK
jgi:uncharacterized damage-inducible protein DinB